jgi:hypothetical protein
MLTAGRWVRFHTQHVCLLQRSDCEIAGGWCNDAKFWIERLNKNILEFFTLSSYFDKIRTSDTNQHVFSGSGILLERRILRTFVSNLNGATPAVR